MPDTNYRVLSMGAVAALALGLGVAWFALSTAPSASSRIDRSPPTAPLTARATVAEGGALRFQASDGTDKALGSLADETGAAAALDGFSRELDRLTAAPGTRDVCGDSNWTLEVDLDGSVPWTQVSWLLTLSYRPPARVYRVRFHLLGALDQGIDHELPRDSCGPTPAPPLAVRALKVVVLAKASALDPTARTIVRAAVVDESRDDAASAKPPEAARWEDVEPLRPALRAKFGALRADASDLLAAVDVPLVAEGGDVPYRDLDAVFLALRDAGFARFELWAVGRALPAR